MRSMNDLSFKENLSFICGILTIGLPGRRLLGGGEFAKSGSLFVGSL